MVEDRRRDEAATALRLINQAWLEGRVEDLAALVHPDIVMVLPGFTGRVQGRDELVAGFRDFCQNARVHEFREHDHHVDVAGSTAVVGFGYEMVYERAGERYRATGRDLWVFQHENAGWIAVWRAMLEMDEVPA